VRADKVTLAALQSVALAYLDGRAGSLPLWQTACEPVEHLRVRAEALCARVPGAKVVDTEAVAGGGSLPGLTIPSCGVAVEVQQPDRFASDPARRGGAVPRTAGSYATCGPSILRTTRT
jgi:hypothetical protein